MHAVTSLEHSVTDLGGTLTRKTRGDGRRGRHDAPTTLR